MLCDFVISVLGLAEGQEGRPAGSIIAAPGRSSRSGEEQPVEGEQGTVQHTAWRSGRALAAETAAGTKERRVGPQVLSGVRAPLYGCFEDCFNGFLQVR